MDDMSKKAGYLTGLLENATLPDNDDTRKLFGIIAELITGLCDRVQDHDTLFDELNDYVESIDDDLAAIEEGGQSFDFDDDDNPFVSEGLHLVNGGTDDHSDTSEISEIAGCVCPKCKTIFLVSAADPAGSSYRCPSCDNLIVPLPLNGDTAQIITPENE